MEIRAGEGRRKSTKCSTRTTRHVRERVVRVAVDDVQNVFHITNAIRVFLGVEEGEGLVAYWSTGWKAKVGRATPRCWWTTHEINNLIGRRMNPREEEEEEEEERRGAGMREREPTNEKIVAKKNQRKERIRLFFEQVCVLNESCFWNCTEGGQETS